jgi:hypothetical protein
VRSASCDVVWEPPFREKMGAPPRALKLLERLWHVARDATGRAHVAAPVNARAAREERARGIILLNKITRNRTWAGCGVPRDLTTRN